MRLLYLLCMLGAVLPAHGEDWPARPVKIVAPFASGGSADTLARIAAEKLTGRLGQNVVVENRPGAGGTIGAEFVARSAADGYTLVVSGIASHVIAPAMSPVPFDPLRSFTHIALFGGPPTVLVVYPGLEARDLKSFVDLAKSRPGGIVFGSPGQGTQGHVTAEMLKAQTGANLTHAPYKGAALAMTDLIAGHIPAASTTLTTAATQIKAGRARALAVSSVQRLPEFADVPTFMSGTPSSSPRWFSLSRPADSAPVAGAQREVRAHEAAGRARAPAAEASGRTTSTRRSSPSSSGGDRALDARESAMKPRRRRAFMASGSEGLTLVA
jgi:tripartite-type tricarboxylate transporter receptor subunit TctC